MKPTSLTESDLEVDMKATFEARYQRDWNDPASEEMAAVWSVAWMASQGLAKSLLAESLGHITDKPWDDESLLHSRISDFLGLEIKYPEMVNQIKAELAGKQGY
ncbi:hypothetical protein [Paracidovorax wautersii]|uniref:Uncharacterized protein n=1 Tax=Paracidovorax wautersii TaxID=1177982 RepID=A0A1I2HV54_9BURK|nr:hypothetical protein [Paracidovorax wautersii]SFF33488.1 hypothetical protein SAMN04489711_1353 [Paracidovorax wautersii]